MTLLVVDGGKTFVPLTPGPISSTKQWGRWGGYCLTGTRHKYIHVASSSAPLLIKSAGTASYVQGTNP